MKEESDLNSNKNDIFTNSETNEQDLFYYSKSNNIPDYILEDFKKKQNFLLVFINPKSGPNQGKTILDYGKQYKIKSISNYNILSFPLLNGSSFNHKFSIILFNILDKEDMAKGKHFIKTYLTDFPNNKITILLGGGDGTPMRIIMDLKKDQIPLDRCIFAPFPLGTGNDISHTMGFGNGIKLNGAESLQNIFNNYIVATPTKLDIWEVYVNFDKEKGLIYDLTGNNRKKILEFKSSFSNSFSIGFDARMGYISEQKRTSSRFCNKFTYAFEGFKRVICCKKNYGVTELLDSLQEGNEIQNSTLSENNPDNKIMDFSDFEEVKSENKENSNDNKRKIVFKTKNNGNSPSDIILTGNPVSFIFQSINYYMAGSYNMWDNSSRFGMAKNEATKEQNEKYKNEIFGQFQRQTYNDKKLEVITFESIFEQGFEKIKKGMGKRIYQGTGPFYLEFKYPDNKSKSALEDIYLNLDGEYYKIEYPKEIIIRLDKEYCGGQLNFLKGGI